MGIEINRARVAADGTVSCEFVFPNIGSFVRVANDAMRVEPDAFAPVTTPAEHYADAAARLRIAAQREAKREAAEQATHRTIPRATVPPYVTPHCAVLGGQPLPEHVQALMQTQVDEPQGLKAGEAYTSDTGETFSADELAVGGTD